MFINYYYKNKKTAVYTPLNDDMTYLKLQKLQLLLGLLLSSSSPSSCRRSS